MTEALRALACSDLCLALTAGSSGAAGLLGGAPVGLLDAADLAGEGTGCATASPVMAHH